MFKNPFQVAIVFALIALLIKLSVFSLGMQHGTMEQYIWYIYMLLLLFSVFFGIRSSKIMHEGSTSVGQDFRAGARTASFFAILVTIITYFYYSKIDPSFFKIKQAEIIENLPNKISTAIKAGDMTIDQIKEKAIGDLKSSQTIFSAYLHSMATMFGLVFIGLFQSLVFAFLMKKFPGFKK